MALCRERLYWVRNPEMCGMRYCSLIPPSVRIDATLCVFLLTVFLGSLSIRRGSFPGCLSSERVLW